MLAGLPDPPSGRMFREVRPPNSVPAVQTVATEPPLGHFARLHYAPPKRRTRTLPPTTDTTMRRKVFPAGGAVLGAVLAVFFLGTLAAAQQPVPAVGAAAAERTAEVGEVLRRGQELEVDHRWGEALSHYEDALRQFPNDHSLERRFEFTRLHYDLGRRYNDRSFNDMLRSMSPEEALDLYCEVLLKIQAHYVREPKWKELVERGTNSFEVALSEPLFLQKNLPSASPQALSDLRHELRSVLGPRVIRTRGDARDAVATAATLVQRRLAISPTTVVLEYTCGATNALDVYSTYLTPDQLTDIYSQIEGSFVGLGIELKANDGALLIVKVIPGSPAHRSGVRPGDRIVAVDGQSTHDLTTDQAANLLQGVEHSVVELTLVSPGQKSRPLRVLREHVEVPSVDQAKLLDPDFGIGYLNLTCFQKTTCRDLDAALWQLHRQGMKSLIMDLRGNPGGLLATAVEVVDKFLDRGIIVFTRGRNSEEDFTYSAHVPGTWRVPLVVLIDRDSASAAEIFAGAIRDHRRGTIIGSPSYGKGSVQGIFPLVGSDAGVRLTTAKFYSPKGHPYSHVGVAPDVTVYQAAKPIDGSVRLPKGTDDDPVLLAALQVARRLVAKR